MVVDEELDNTVAFMLLEKGYPYSEAANNIVIYPPYSAETAGDIYAIKYIPDHRRGRGPESGPLINPNTESPDTLVEWVDPSPQDRGASITLKPGYALRSGFGYALRNSWHSEQKLKLSRKQVEKWNRAAAFINKHESPDFQSQLPQALRPTTFYTWRYPNTQFHESLAEISPNFPDIITYFSFSEIDQYFTDYLIEIPVFGLVATLLPLVYGGVHLSAWNFEFPTKIELLLWKISCFGIMATVPVLFLYAIFRLLLSIDARALEFLSYPVFLFYILARCYLVVESFISLRSVPIGVYWTPSWLQMLPHI